MQAITRADAWIPTVSQAPCRNRVYPQVIPSQVHSAARQTWLHEFLPRPTTLTFLLCAVAVC